MKRADDLLRHSAAAQIPLFYPSPGPCGLEFANAILRERHYLGAVQRGRAWCDEFGIAVWKSPPTARHLPPHWVELCRWCLYGQRNGGSRQFARMRKWLRVAFPEATSAVSYSDPSKGHTGALYKACGWKWAPTWHRIAPPPTGNGSWDGGRTRQSVKDRWVYALAEDTERAAVLSLDRTYAERIA